MFVSIAFTEKCLYQLAKKMATNTVQMTVQQC